MYYYSYSNQGVRFKKELLGGDTIYYYHDGEKLLAESHNNKTIRYMYDIDGIRVLYSPINHNHIIM